MTVYDRDDYPYSPAVEARILKRDGGVIRCRYTGQTFASLKGTDIEHVVVLVRAKYGLTVDRRERAALEKILTDCQWRD